MRILALGLLCAALALAGCGAPEQVQPAEPTETAAPTTAPDQPTQVPVATLAPTSVATATPSPAPPGASPTTMPTVVELAQPSITPPASVAGPASAQTALPAPATSVAIARPPIAGIVQPTPAPEGGAVLPDALRDRVLDDLARRAGVDRAAIQVESVEAVIWNDGSLGCARPGVEYTQATQEGFRVLLTAGGARYDYRATLRGSLVVCER